MGAEPATASPLVRRYTLDEFFELELPPGHGHYELIAGVLYVVPPTTSLHNEVVSRLNLRLAAYVNAHPRECHLYVPRAAIWTSRHTYLEPDLFLVSAALARRLDPERPDTADLVIEVMSPRSSVYDRTAKADTYAALGVRELWLVDLEARSLERRVLRDEGAYRIEPPVSGGDACESAVFPGLRLVVRDVFPD
jgi:Uma2 family endonuclease